MKARCACNRYGLRYGLGVLGVGEMWFLAEPGERECPEWQALPVEPCGQFGHDNPTPLAPLGALKNVKRETDRGLH